MHKRFALVLAGAAALTTLGTLAAQADGPALVVTPVGSATITTGAGPDGTAVFLSGNSQNPAPLNGYVKADAGGVTCDGAENPYDDAGNPNPNWSDSNHCPPID